VQHADDLVAFIRSLRAGPVHLVGHSRGATVALYATRSAPELVRSLTFAEGGSSMAAFDTDNPATRDAATDWRPLAKEKLKAGETDAALEMFVTRVNGPGAWQSTPEPTRQSLRSNAWTLFAMWDDQPRWPPFSCDDALRLGVPVLLLEGERSPKSFHVILDKIQPCLRRAERRRVMNSSHSMPRMNPGGFTSEVLAFVSRH
jgi:pimeloyl-ACP methyl ester carboxylesterase